MKNQKEFLVVITLLLISISTLVGSKSNIRFNIPVRVFIDTRTIENLEKDDFIFLVNGNETEIVEFTSLKRSISHRSVLGRSLILSFQATEYSQSLADGISYFITQNVSHNDILFIVSPLKFYQIQVTPNKGNMINNIDKLLKRDFHVYKKERTLVEESLFNKIKIVRIALAKEEERDYDIARYTTVMQFVNNYPLEFLGFKKRFLFSDILKIRHIADLIASRGGDKWWIHFQEREVSALFPKTKDIIKKLNEYETIADYNLGYKQGLAYLKKQLQFSYSFPFDELKNILLKNNISYNVVLFSGKKDLDLNNVQGEISDLKIVFDKISMESGGKMVSIMTPEQGIREIENHWDFYFELGFNFNGQLEDKHLNIRLKKRSVFLSYLDIFLMNEIKSFIENESQSKIKIGQLSFKKNNVTFLVDSFKLDQKEKFGIIKVHIKLFDDQNMIVYTKNNTLRAFKNKISVSIPLPNSYRGKYKLNIMVFDMIANHCDTAEDSLEL